MYRVEKTFLKYLKPHTMRIVKHPIGSGGYDIIDDTHHIYGHSPTVEAASLMLIDLYSQYVYADHNPYLATEEELAAREPAPLTEAEKKLNELVNNLDL